MGFQIELDLRNHNKLLLEENEQLQAKVAELEEENARLNSSPTIEACRQMIRDKAVIEASTLHEQLAAEQLNNKRLRDALQEYIDEHEECQDADDWMAMMCSMEAHHTADEALSQPSDTSALDTFVAEKVKEIIESHAPEGRNVTNAQHVEMRHKFVEQIATLTRQRDLAVEAWAGILIRNKRGIGASSAEDSSEQTTA